MFCWDVLPLLAKSIGKGGIRVGATLLRRRKVMTIYEKVIIVTVSKDEVSWERKD